MIRPKSSLLPLPPGAIIGSMITVRKTKGAHGDLASVKAEAIGACIYALPARPASLPGGGAGRMDPRFLEKQDRLTDVDDVLPRRAPSGHHSQLTGSGCQRRGSVYHDRPVAVGGAGEASIYFPYQTHQTTDR